uniref:AMP-dependent synthetase/ligase domain-containing protein n=1 Tax=Rhodosorus marinus TaxID=101924 RepID=A0A7S2ZML0_9RHOD|mmetsp:Transcript_24955/g.98581  ORF Transcript_24955/g.98581 Transcript_24955/m.98581 type:complete len:402 (+) Transcript_24955:185-1390(+)
MAFTIGHARLELRGRRLANHRRRNGFVVRSSVSKVAYLPPETPPASVPLEKHLAQCESINEIWKGVLDEFGDSIALVDPLRGHEEGISFTQFEQLYKKCASTLRKLGMSKGQCMSVFSENSLNWLVLDQGLLRNGMINSVRGSAAPALELEFIFQDSESVALAVQDVKLLKKLESVLNPAEVKFVLILQGAKSAESAFDGSVPVYSFEEFIGLGEEDENHDTTVKKSDVATILYTSGTTGKPKGVPLTHGNILHQIVNVRLGEAHPRPEGVFVSILPCWHIFERTIEYISLAYGTRMVYSSIKSFRDDLAKYQPTHLVGVPRLFESLYGAVNSKFTSGSAFKKLLVQYLVQASGSGIDEKSIDYGNTQLIRSLLGSLQNLLLRLEGMYKAEIRNQLTFLKR